MTRAFFDAVHADPWAVEFVDLYALNVGASGAIEEAIERTRSSARTEPKSLRSTSLVMLGPPGAGKTHLFTRLRRRVGPRAVFIHIRPLVHAEMTPRFVLGEIVRQLAYETVKGFPQVSALVGSLLGHLSGAGTDFPSMFVGELNELPEAERTSRLQNALEQVLETWPETDESYLERLLMAPFAAGSTRRALLSWLSGRDCEVAQLERIGATASLSEERALGALRTLSAVASPGAPIVIVFDQLENLVDAAGPNSRLAAYANLTAELIDTMRGFVIVHMALDTEWERAIAPSFNLSQRSRLVMGQVALELPSAQQREELLRLFVERIPERPEVFPWPLGEARVARLRAQPGLTPRMLLVECRRALEGDVTAIDVEPDPVESEGEAQDASLDAEWRTLLALAREQIQEATEQRAALDPARLADGLLAAGEFMSGAQIRPALALPLRLLLKVGARNEYMALVQESNHRSLAATLTKLTTLTASAPVIALRERVRDLPPTWKETLKKRAALLATKKARWIDLESEDCARLLALDALLQAARSGDVTGPRGQPLTEQQVKAWVTSALQVNDWEIVTSLALTAEDAAAEATAAEGAAAETEIVNIERPATAATENGNSSTLATLRRLRVASLDRLVREVLRIEPSASRASVLAAIEAASDSVQLVGRSIVCMRSQR